MNQTPPDSNDRAHPVIRFLDRGVLVLVHGLLLGATFRARDPGERLTNLLRGDPQDEVRIRGWEAVLQWSPEKRVGCFAGVVIGIAIGGAILWYGTR
jgi:hypothetical protein